MFLGGVASFENWNLTSVLLVTVTVNPVEDHGETVSISAGDITTELVS